MGKKARTNEWVIVTYGRFLFDRRAPRVTKAACTFWSQPKARETLQKRPRKFDQVVHSLSVSGTCSIFTFLVSKLLDSTLLRLPCSPGTFEMSRHCNCREDDGDGGGPATKVPLESIDDNPTHRQTRSSLPALDLEKCLLCDSNKKREKLLKPRATYPLYLGVYPNDSAQHCSNLESTKDDVCSWRSTSRQTFMRRKWWHASCYRKYTSPKSLDSVAIANKENAQNFSDHSTGTEPKDSVLASSTYLTKTTGEGCSSL